MMPRTDPATAGALCPATFTEILSLIRSGERRAWSALLPLVYADLHRLARAYMRDYPAGPLLQPTALVNETYLGLLRQKSAEWKSKAHFLGIAALLMRRIL